MHEVDMVLKNLAAFGKCRLRHLDRILAFSDLVRCIHPEPWMGHSRPIRKELDPFASPPD